MEKNYSYLKYLSYKAKENPSAWVIDPSDEEEIDYDRPSKDRLNAYQLNGTKRIIYLSDAVYEPLVREDWKEEKAQQRYDQRCDSLDKLYEDFQVEPDSEGRLITKDNYYLYITNKVEATEEEANEYLNSKLEEFLLSLSGIDKQITDLLKEGKTQRDIAAKLGVSQVAIQKRIKKVKKYFNKWLSNPNSVSFTCEGKKSCSVPSKKKGGKTKCNNSKQS